jgi:hypothetical protein
MLLERPILHRLAADALADLRRDGIEVAPEDVLWLNHLAGKCVRPTAADEILFLDPPVLCGFQLPFGPFRRRALSQPLLLWPLSIGARLWLEQYGRPWFHGCGDMEPLAVAYAMANARRPDLLRALSSRLRAHLKIAWWATRLTASLAQLSEAIARALNPEDLDLVDVPFPGERKPDRSLAADYGDVLAQLCHFYGETPSHWLWQVSEDTCAAMLRKLSAVLPKEMGTDPSSPKFRLLSQFRLAVGEIRKRQNPEARMQ